jgi:hypothetical protein
MSTLERLGISCHSLSAHDCRSAAGAPCPQNLGCVAAALTAPHLQRGTGEGDGAGVVMAFDNRSDSEYSKRHGGGGRSLRPANCEVEQLVVLHNTAVGFPTERVRVVASMVWSNGHPGLRPLPEGSHSAVGGGPISGDRDYNAA